MSKLLLPVLVGVFVGAFTIELVRRNDPELMAGVEAKAKRLARSLERRFGRTRRRLAGGKEGA